MNGLAPGFAGNGGTGGAAGAAPAGMGLPFALPEHSELDQVNSNLALLPFAVAVSPNSFNMQLKYRLVGPEWARYSTGVHCSLNDIKRRRQKVAVAQARTVAVVSSPSLVTYTNTMGAGWGGFTWHSAFCTSTQGCRDDRFFI